jgi:excisionase family DNA binding protein
MALSKVVHMPTREEAEVAKMSSRALSKYADNDQLNLKITHNGEAIEGLTLPSVAINMLLDVLTEVSKGNAVTVMPVLAELSTQEAAGLLNVSRPYLVGLLEGGKIPFGKVGAHRRVLAKDLMDYKERIDQERLDSLAELTAQAQEVGMGYE